MTLCVVAGAGSGQCQRPDDAEEEGEGPEDSAGEGTQAAGAGAEGTRQAREAGLGQEEEVCLWQIVIVKSQLNASDRRQYMHRT